MSNCPRCDKPARHEALLIEWETKKLLIQHYCDSAHPTMGFRGYRFVEPVKDRDAVLRIFNLKPVAGRPWSTKNKNVMKRRKAK